MNEKDIKSIVVPLATFSSIVILSLIGHITESRRLKKEGKDLRMQDEALKINRQTKKWMTGAAKRLDPTEFGEQLNDRIDFARFIADH